MAVLHQTTMNPTKVELLAAWLPSNTADPTVTSRPVTNGPLAVTGSTVEVNGPSGTDLRHADGTTARGMFASASLADQPA